MKFGPLYIETLIRAPMERIWELTQNPELHQRWDLRFSSITYLPREQEEPQRFLYTTRIGFGLTIEGEGESVGEAARPDGSRSSALKFWSRDPKSLIREGSGFWKYVPEERGVIFLTRYNYQARFGTAGRLLDGMIFRPMMQWATAWSFERLRLWAENGLPPDAALRNGAIYTLSRGAVAAAWIYQGLVPKLLGPHADEISLLLAAGIDQPHFAASVFGILEVAFGVLTIVLWKQSWPLILTILTMVVALAQVAITAPAYLAAAFNPVTLNLLMVVCACCALLVRQCTPFASATRQKPPAP